MEARQYVTRDKSKYFIVLSFLLRVCGKMMVYTRWNLRLLHGKLSPTNSLQRLTIRYMNARLLSW